MKKYVPVILLSEYHKLLKDLKNKQTYRNEKEIEIKEIKDKIEFYRVMEDEILERINEIKGVLNNYDEKMIRLICRGLNIDYEIIGKNDNIK